MKKLNLQPNIRTYELLFSLFGNVNAPYEEGNMLSQVDVAKRINAIEMDMIKNGLQHSHLSLRNVVNDTLPQPRQILILIYLTTILLPKLSRDDDQPNICTDN